MAEPAYKSSSLKRTGLYSNPQDAQEGAESPGQGASGGEGGQSAPEPSRPDSKPARKRRTQTTIYHNDDDLKRAEAAMTFTMGHTGLRSWTAFVEHAINKYTLELEQQYNNSTPFGT